MRGFAVDGTYTFHGIKYADAKRFQMPTPPQPWDGVKDAHSYGYVCPMIDPETAVGEIMVPHRYWPKDENCQYLNIWTQSLDTDAKRPVMVWFHGGGFSAGSSIEQVAYDGENLSKFGNVVVVNSEPPAEHPGVPGPLPLRRGEILELRQRGQRRPGGLPAVDPRQHRPVWRATRKM